MPLRRLLPLAILAGCAATPPLVTTGGNLGRQASAYAPAYAVAGDSAAAAEVRRQLADRGWFDANAAAVIRVGYAAAPHSLGTCLEPDPENRNACKRWLDPPDTSWSPFTPSLRYRLTLVVDTPGNMAAGRVEVVQSGEPDDMPLPELVTAALAKLQG